MEKGSISFSYSAEAERTGRVYSTAHVDAKGRFSIKGFDGLECWTHGHAIYSARDRVLLIAIAPVKIAINADTPRVKVIAPLPGDANNKD